MDEPGATGIWVRDEDGAEHALTATELTMAAERERYFRSPGGLRAAAGVVRDLLDEIRPMRDTFSLDGVYRLHEIMATGESLIAALFHTASAIERGKA